MSQSNTFKDHFSKLAAQYAAFRPLYPAALFPYLASLCPVRQLAWDCACGTGQASVPLVEHFTAVIATDASVQQIQAATPHPQVTYRVATAEQSGLDAASVDLIAVAQALHWFDHNAFYHEARRVLRDTGVLAVWSYGNLQVENEAVDQRIQTFYDSTVGPYWPPERQLVETGYRTLPFPFAEIIPPRVGTFSMEEHWSLPQLLGYLRSWSATGRYVAQHGEDPVTALGDELARLWGDEERKYRVSWPLVFRIGRK